MCICQKREELKVNGPGLDYKKATLSHLFFIRPVAILVSPHNFFISEKSLSRVSQNAFLYFTAHLSTFSGLGKGYSDELC